MCKCQTCAEYNTTNTLCLFPSVSKKLIFTVPKKVWAEVNILVSLLNFLDDALKTWILVMFIVNPLLVCLIDRVCTSTHITFESVLYNNLIAFSVMTLCQSNYLKSDH